MLKLIRNRKGFTLMELLLVFLFLGVLGTLAATSYFNSTKDFKYFENYKYLTTSIREARSNALTNKEIAGELPSSYGVRIESDSLTLFAYNGNAETIIQQYSLEDTAYELSVIDPENYSDLNLPVTLFYATGGYGDLNIIEGEGTGDEDTYYPAEGGDEENSINHSTVIKFVDSDRDIERFVVIVNFSGIPEEVLQYPISVDNADIEGEFLMMQTSFLTRSDELDMNGSEIKAISNVKEDFNLLKEEVEMEMQRGGEIKEVNFNLNNGFSFK
jgi:type II secretory pathway pseudopilin PulG